MTKTVLDYDLLHADILVRLNMIGMPQRYLDRKKGWSRSTLFRIQHHKKITMETFFTITDWLGGDKSKYFKTVKINQTS